METKSVAIITAIGNPNAYKDFSHVLKMFELQVQTIAKLEGSFHYYCVSNLSEEVVIILQRHLSDKQFTLVECNFPPPLPKGESVGHRTEDSYNIFMTDKGCRLITGFVRALEASHTYTYFIDCDDWLSKEIPFFFNQSTADICYVDKGFIVDFGNKKFKPCRGLFRFCGSTIAYKTTFLQTEFSEELKDRKSFNSKSDILKSFDGKTVSLMFGDHMEWFWRYSDKEVKIQDVPFPAVSWIINTGQNVSQSAYDSSLWPSLSVFKSSQMRKLVDIDKTYRLKDILFKMLQQIKQIPHIFLVSESFKKNRLYFSLGQWIKSKSGTNKQ